MEHAQPVSRRAAARRRLHGHLRRQSGPFLTEYNPLVRERRSGADLFHFTRGDRIAAGAAAFANEVRILLAEHARSNRRLAVVKTMLHGQRALAAQGLVLEDGEEVTGNGRLVENPDMVCAMQHAHAHIMTDMEMLCPGVSMQELTRRSHRLAPICDRQKYSCLLHGVGLCDEWPLITYPDAFVEGAFDQVLELGMTKCVEALVSPEGGDFSIKLKEQVLITETG